MASRNLVHLQKIILRCVDFCFYFILETRHYAIKATIKDTVVAMATKSTNKGQNFKIAIGSIKEGNLLRLFFPLKLKNLMMRNQSKKYLTFLANFGCTSHLSSALHRHRRGQGLSPREGLKFFTPFSPLYLSSAKKLR